MIGCLRTRVRKQPIIALFFSLRLYSSLISSSSCAPSSRCPVLVCTWSYSLLSIISLNYLSLMEFPTLINWTNPFPFYGLLDGNFYFHPNFSKAFCKQTDPDQTPRYAAFKIHAVCSDFLTFYTISIFICNMRSAIVQSVER